MRLKKCLLCGMRISPVVGRAAGHRAHLEDLQLDPFAAQNRPGFIPIHLCFRAPRVRLRHEHFAVFHSQLLPPTPHITADRTLAAAEARQLALQAMRKCDAPYAVASAALTGRTRKIWSMKSDAASSLRSRRCWGLLAAGSALRNASRTIRLCTLNFRETPAIVPTPNSYSRRICSKSSTLSLLVSQLRFRCPIHEA